MPCAQPSYQALRTADPLGLACGFGAALSGCVASRVQARHGSDLATNDIAALPQAGRGLARLILATVGMRVAVAKLEEGETS